MIGWHNNVSLWMWRYCERVRLGANFQKNPLQEQRFLFHLELWRWQFSPMTLVLSQWRTGCERCHVALYLFQSHGRISAMFKHKFLRYLKIKYPPPRCVSLLQFKYSEDLSHVEMSVLSAENPINDAMPLTSCQHKKLCLTYRVVASRPL